MEKVNHCGIRGIANDWFGSYLSDKLSSSLSMVSTLITKLYNMVYLRVQF